MGGPDKDRVVAIIPSAGSGVRMRAGTKKNYLELAGRPVLAHTLAAFDEAASVDAVVVVVSPGDEGLCTEKVVDAYGLKKVEVVIPGGAERQDSVGLALEYLKGSARPPGIIVVHDGARPLVTPKIIDATIEAARESGAAIAAVRLKDTIKEAGPDDTVIRTIERDRLRSVQTPQAFLATLLYQAFARALSDGFAGTDESSLVERLGIRVRLVEGSYENIKITTPEDLPFAESVLEKRAAR